MEYDGLGMSYPAEFVFDALDQTQMLVGTCRLWRGPESGVGWTVANAISPVLDGSASGLDCAGNGLIRSIGAGPVAAGGEVIYVGMAGNADGGGVVAGHLFSARLAANGMVSGGWTDLALSPVVNTGGIFNAESEDVSAIYVSPGTALPFRPSTPAVPGLRHGRRDPWAPRPGRPGTTAAAD